MLADRRLGDSIRITTDVEGVNWLKLLNGFLIRVDDDSTANS